MKNDANETAITILTNTIGELEPIAGCVNGIASSSGLPESAKALLAANAEALGNLVEALRGDLRQLVAPPAPRKVKAPPAPKADPRQAVIPAVAAAEGGKKKRGRPSKADQAAATGNSASTAEGATA